ncbi:MAG: A24 family peptidase [Candidatus Rifleibacteriota bacterium]
MLNLENLTAKPEYIAQLLAVTIAFIAMLTDMIKGKIYNWLTFPMILAGWAISLIFFGLSGFAYSFAATLIGIALYFIPAALGIVGMGDVKLMAAIGSLCGTNFVISVFLYTSILGIPHALIVQFINYRRNALSMLLTSFSTKSFLDKTIQKENLCLNQKNKKVRFLLGVDIFLATIIAVFYSFSLSL